MSGSGSVIDLSKLPTPKVIEELDFEALFQEYLSDFLGKDTKYDTLVESDPAIVVLEVMAYREMLIRKRINESAKATMLAFATDSDLDHIVAEYGVERLEDEKDDRLRMRGQMALEGFSTAGPIKAYEFHALSASAKVKSVHVESNEPGVVEVYILSTEGNGQADEELLNIVKEKLNEENIRPLTDKVEVTAAEILEYEIGAKINVYSGPSFSVVEETANEGINEYTTERQALGEVVAISGIYDALHVKGVRNVKLIEPVEDIVPTKKQAAFCSKINLEIEINYGT